MHLSKNINILFDKKVKISSLPNNKHLKPNLHLLLSLLFLLRGSKHLILYGGEGNVALYYFALIPINKIQEGKAFS